MVEKPINFYQSTERIATSGQPDREQIHSIAEQGYEVVINLATHDSSSAIPDEGSLVAHVRHLRAAEARRQRRQLLRVLDAVRIHLERRQVHHGVRPVLIEKSPARRVISQIAIFAADEDVLPRLGRAPQGAPHQSSAARHQHLHAWCAHVTYTRHTFLVPYRE
mgnify:CR=1 FL=1